MKRILIVEDEALMRESLRRALHVLGYSVETVVDGVGGLETIVSDPPDVVLLDLMLGDEAFNGMEFLERVRGFYPEMPVVMMTGYGTVDRAVQAMHLGVSEFIRKPFDLDQLREALGRIEENVGRQSAVRQRKSLVNGYAGVDSFICQSKTMQSIVERIGAIGKNRGTQALIVGERGSGKTALAQLLHVQDLPHDRPLISVDCGKVPDLHGIFTHLPNGDRNTGELADGGSLLLEDVHCLSSQGQQQLLAFLMHRRIQGARGDRAVDVRLIATSSEVLTPTNEGGSFDPVLLQRLGANSFILPPLRERCEDLAPMCRLFWGQMGTGEDEGDLHERLPVDYVWPGNVRELKNWVERQHLLAQAVAGGLGKEMSRLPLAELLKQVPQEGIFDGVLRQLLVYAMRQSGGDRERARRQLGLDRQRFVAYLAQYGLTDDDEK